MKIKIYTNSSQSILLLTTIFIGIFVGINYHSLVQIFWQFTIPNLIFRGKNEILDNFKNK